MAESNVKPGGLSFEVNILRCCVVYLNSIVIDIQVVLEEAKTSDKPAITASPESPSLTAEELEKKLQEVEDRRKSLEAATLERLAEAEKRAEEVIYNKEKLIKLNKIFFQVRERKATMPETPNEAE